jgi:hypothetical protein
VQECNDSSTDLSLSVLKAASSHLPSGLPSWEHGCPTHCDKLQVTLRIIIIIIVIFITYYLLLLFYYKLLILDYYQ